MGIALALGAPSVTCVDPDEQRRAVAEQLGATVIDPPEPGAGIGPFPITVDTSAGVDGLTLALRSTAPDGVCTSVGIYYAPTALPLFEMYATGVTFHTGRVHARTVTPAVLDLIGSGRFDPTTLH